MELEEKSLDNLIIKRIENQIKDFFKNKEEFGNFINEKYKVKKLNIDEKLLLLNRKIFDYMGKYIFYIKATSNLIEKLNELHNIEETKYFFKYLIYLKEELDNDVKCKNISKANKINLYFALRIVNGTMRTYNIVYLKDYADDEVKNIILEKTNCQKKDIFNLNNLKKLDYKTLRQINNRILVCKTVTNDTKNSERILNNFARGVILNEELLKKLQLANNTNYFNKGISISDID